MACRCSASASNTHNVVLMELGAYRHATGELRWHGLTFSMVSKHVNGIIYSFFYNPSSLKSHKTSSHPGLDKNLEIRYIIATEQCGDLNAEVSEVIPEVWSKRFESNEIAAPHSLSIDATVILEV